MTPQETPDFTLEAEASFAAPTGSALWAVMKAHAWDSITTAHGIPLMCPPEGPHRFIPVFNTREQAVAWAGSDEHVAMLMSNVGTHTRRTKRRCPRSGTDSAIRRCVQ
jgi:hypothetical protein